MYFVGVDTAQVNTGISIIDENNKGILTKNLVRDMPDDSFGLGVPDFIKNHSQFFSFKETLKDFIDDIKMIVFEGPNYGSSNITQISIGSIHGVYWEYCMEHQLNFAVLTPKSINYSVFGTAKNITKRDTINAMKAVYPDLKIRDSNMADSLAMASLARKFYLLTHGGIELTSAEKEVLISKKKYKGEPKGLIYKRNKSFILFEGGQINWQEEEHHQVQ